MKDRRKKPELLCPAGDPEILRVAVRYGADAVYIGGEAFGLRQNAGNATIPELRSAVEFAHEKGVKVYVTANVLAHDRDIQEAGSYFGELGTVGMDAVLIADPGMFSVCRRVLPSVPIHISTQANNVNYETFRFWYELGVKRVVAGRELSLRELKEIRENVPDDMEIEAFVHGSMCISYSGRCLLSNVLAGRDANLGNCAHPCRWNYVLMEETRPGEFFPIEENERGTFIMNSKDLCMVDHLPDLLNAGVDSLKIEGRMKNALYVATVTRAYRLAIDDASDRPEVYEKNRLHYREEIEKCTVRGFSTGFFFGRPGAEDMIYDRQTYLKNYVYLGTAGETRDGFTALVQKNKFSVGN
ncbi:MAG: U32 family peptidase, partial [Lachnospiraceae bacterium]|nr:U32 family peptidase [Lachnospiraceae bacterium]